MTAPVWLVTGASSGVGRVLAVALAASGAEVLLAGRNLRALEDTASWCGALAKTFLVDLADTDSVSSLAPRVREHLAGRSLAGRSLAGMVHCAGLMVWDSPSTASGWSQVPLVNAVSPWRLTIALEQELLANEAARVLFVAGAAFTLQNVLPDTEGWKGAQRGRGLRLALEAAAAKVWMARSLRRRWGGRASAFAFHPGFVKSHLADQLPFPLSTLGCLAQGFLSTRCKTGEFLALDPAAPGLSGNLVDGKRAVVDCPAKADQGAEEEFLRVLGR